jgi:predicted enzyme related to lactoylglutathione lyase
MTSDLSAVCFDAHDPLRLAAFWGAVLAWETADDADGGISLRPSDDTGFRVRFLRSRAPKTGQNQMHFDLTSRSLEEQRATVSRALDLGGRHIDVGQRPEELHVVLADPEGNEFCVVEPGNAFLADCGFIGAVSCDGSQEAGYFWSEALGWRLVWDQDQETAIRSPRGGPKISWGGPPLMPRSGPNRLYFDLAPASGADPQEEVKRLASLGATRIDLDLGHGEGGPVLLTDPDGNLFRVLAP